MAGPSWLPLSPLDSIGPELLSRDDLRAAVWGVERFVSEDETHRVDMGQTVAATARAGGLPDVRFEHAIYPREVWLWWDDMVQDPTVSRVLNEWEQTLSRAGLPVRLGTFDDMPDRIRWDGGQEFSPLVLEGHRQSAVVVVLTDGYGMRLVAESELDRATLVTILLAFAEWPRLVFVDVSEGQHGLATRLEPYGLRCIVLDQLPAFLGANSVPPVSKRRADATLHGDLQVWAAATALSPEPVAADRAFALRDYLKLSLSSRLFHGLLADVGSLEDRLDWPPGRRAELLNWLTQCSLENENGRIGEDSLLAQALDYWLGYYRDLDAERDREESALLPWRQTQAQRRLRMEIALLELWRQPAEAAKELYALYSNAEMARDIRERFNGLTDRDGQDAKRAAVALPWREAEQPITVRWMLANMGFGGGDGGGGQLRRPVGLSLVLGGCVGLAVIGIAMVGWHLFGPAAPAFRDKLPPALQEMVIKETYRTGTRTYAIAVGGPKYLVVTSAPAHSVVTLKWVWKPLDNVVKLGRSELWHAGTLSQAIRGCEPGWPWRSLVAIEAEPSDAATRELAMALLDRGSADAVLLGVDWAAHQPRLIQLDPAMTEPDQLLLILPADAAQPELSFRGRVGVVRTGDLQKLTSSLAFDGVKSLREIWPEVAIQGQGRLRGGPEKERDEASGMTFVTVCGGAFRMGSTEKDLEIIEETLREAYRDELPQHIVTMRTFEISETEVTNAQFRKWRDHPGEDARPATDVTWQDAKDFCEHFDDALPTEAQWEYAARGGSGSHWSFGDDIAQLGTYAWFSENSGSKAHVVKDREPNPLGLYDMHGNVYEWVEDCYDREAYKNRSEFINNPHEKQNCDLRVLRGGLRVVRPEGPPVRVPERARARDPGRRRRLPLCPPLPPPALTSWPLDLLGLKVTRSVKFFCLLGCHLTTKFVKVVSNYVIRQPTFVNEIPDRSCNSHSNKSRPNWVSQNGKCYI